MYWNGGLVQDRTQLLNLVVAKGYLTKLVGNDAVKSFIFRHEPEILELSSTRYQNYEFPDPERFVPDGYALVRVDVRGTGRSGGEYRYM